MSKTSRYGINTRGTGLHWANMGGSSSSITGGTTGTGTGAAAPLPGNAFSDEMLAGMYQQALQASQQDESNRQTGIQQSMNARGVAGPNVAAITSPGSLARRRGALASANLDARAKGLELGVGEYQAQTSRQGVNNQAAQYGSDLTERMREFNAGQNNWQQQFGAQQARDNPAPRPQNPFTPGGEGYDQWWSTHGISAGGANRSGAASGAYHAGAPA